MASLLGLGLVAVFSGRWRSVSFGYRRVHPYAAPDVVVGVGNVATKFEESKHKRKADGTFAEKPAHDFGKKKHDAPAKRAEAEDVRKKLTKAPDAPASAGVSVKPGDVQKSASGKITSDGS